MKEKLKPCELPCPKCGSDDIVCEWIPAKQCRVSPNYKTLTGYSIEYDGDKKATKWCRIRHHCRCCKFEWDTRTKE
jgi:hypothetical protein